jgi:hypothetical protein
LTLLNEKETPQSESNERTVEQIAYTPLPSCHFIEAKEDCLFYFAATKSTIAENNCAPVIQQTVLQNPAA